MSPPSLSLDATGHVLRSPAIPRPRREGLATPVTLPRMELVAAPRRNNKTAVIAILALHGVMLFALLNLQRVRETVPESAPIFLDVVSAPKPTPPSKPLPTPPRRQSPTPPPVVAPLVAPTPSPSPSPLLAQATSTPPPAPVAHVVEALPTPPEPAPAPTPTPTTIVKTVMLSAVQYLNGEPSPVYSPISARLKESGRVLVRVFVDSEGVPGKVEISQSSGFSRLDNASIVAVRNVRFKPYVENGNPVAFWVFIPFDFDL